MGAALRGERDPIEKLGITIKQADINARLAAEGLSDLEGEARKAAEAEATLAIIMEQSADYAGAQAAATDSAAVQMAQFRATVTDLAASMGQALLPIVAAVAGQLNDLAGFLAENEAVMWAVVGAMSAYVAAWAAWKAMDVATGLVTTAGELAKIVRSINLAKVGQVAWNAALVAYRGIVTAVRAITAAWTAAQLALNVALTANPIGVVVVAVGLLVAAIAAALYFTRDKWMPIVEAMWEQLKAFGSWIADVWMRGWEYVQQGLDALVQWIQRTWKSLLDWWKRLWSEFLRAVQSVIDRLKSAWQRFSSFISQIFGRMKQAAQSVAYFYRDIFTAALDAVRSAIDRLIGTIQRIIRWLRELRDRAREAMRELNPLRGGFSFGFFGGRSYGARGYAMAAPSTRANQAAVNITVNGAIDPVATAEQIRRLLDRQNARMGRPTTIWAATQ
jgi:phage-related protein